MDDNTIGIIFGLIAFPLWYGSGNRLRAAVEAEGGQRYALIALVLLLFFFGFFFMGMANVYAPLAIRHFFIPVSMLFGIWGWHRQKTLGKKPGVKGTQTVNLKPTRQAKTGNARGDAFDPAVSRSVVPKRAKKKTGSLLDTFPNHGSDTGYVPRARGDVWDSYYDQLVALNGCGPATAQRIIEKVQGDQELTNRERNFWQQVN